MPLAWPNSPAAIAMKKLRRMVALSSAFQTRAGIEYEDAIKRVFFEYVPNAGELLREGAEESTVDPVSPFAAIWPMTTDANAVAGGAQVWTLSNGILHLYVSCDPLPELTDWNERRLEAVGFLDQWIQDVINLSGADDDDTDDGMGHLEIVHAPINMIDHVPFKDRKSAGDYYYMSVGLKYGGEQ